MSQKTHLSSQRHERFLYSTLKKELTNFLILLVFILDSVMTLTFTIKESTVPQASGGKAISKSEFDEN